MYMYLSDVIHVEIQNYNNSLFFIMLIRAMVYLLLCSFKTGHLLLIMMVTDCINELRKKQKKGWLQIVKQYLTPNF